MLAALGAMLFYAGVQFTRLVVDFADELEASARAVYDWLHAVEDANGRDRSGPRFSDRTLDIDVVYYGDLVVEGPGHLRIPRPELRHAFVLKPLADIAPEFIDPVRGLSLRQMWQAHPQHGDVFDTVELAD